ncbi:Protein trichome birefringence-like 21 [Forsythia ovata]|uniref:Protein trichome birefringence-like 21 n=1 Tax=Forsythia ovata TaxID=205694 RepID=A0ABD1UD91_9LAMI
MKLQTSELPLGKPQPRRKTQKLAPLIVSAFLLTIITLSYPGLITDSQKISDANSQAFESLDHDSITPTTDRLDQKNSQPCSIGKIYAPGCSNSVGGEEIIQGRNPAPNAAVSPPLTTIKRDMAGNKTVAEKGEENCDLFSGEWVPNPDGPYYTNLTCNAIEEHQNCMKFGRPDLGFLKWRWKPDACELPIFDPHQVVYPVDVSSPTDANKHHEYREYNFNISIFSSPYLVRTEKTDPNDITRPFNLYLDEYDQHWTNQIEGFDYVIISAGQWFFRPTYFYLNHSLVGCLYCPEANVTHLTSSFSYQHAFRTALRVTYLRTFAPSHFEGGHWDKGGDCARTRPFKRNETVLEDFSSQMYSIQIEELKTAQEEARRKSGSKFRLFDTTKSMLLRPDGHPSKYGHWPVQNVTLANDCVHWCLPGPIDSWNDLLQELLKREIQINDNRSLT